MFITEKGNRFTTLKIFTALAKKLHIEVNEGRIDIPKKYGQGYCIGYDLNSYIRVLITDFSLKKPIKLVNPEPLSSKKKILFKFLDVGHQAYLPTSVHAPTRVLIATSRITTTSSLYIDSNSSINIEVDVDYLKKELGGIEELPLIQNLVTHNTPLLFEEIIPRDILQIVTTVFGKKIEDTFGTYYLRIKVEEVICRLLEQLEQRKDKTYYALHPQDIQTLYAIKDLILSDLAIPPRLNELANEARMSMSKLQRLFKQIFGSTIFNFYQEARIQEAAFLLREHQRTVSEVGYQLGFTNLSHFSKVFQAYMGEKPKQYTKIHTK
ncbi:helix-turn-helix transcriptional regulator [Myroides sp. TSA_177.3]|uniref:helix-turn-helix transcriptional regulator n=1 Tax=Myroides sp. TSA_177.3 TaxID=3415650 RepID=UPI0040466794